MGDACCGDDESASDVEGVLVVLLVLFLLFIQPFFDATPLLQKSLFAAIFLRFLTPAETLPTFVFSFPRLYYIRPVAPC